MDPKIARQITFLQPDLRPLVDVRGSGPAPGIVFGLVSLEGAVLHNAVTIPDHQTTRSCGARAIHFHLIKGEIIHLPANYLAIGLEPGCCDVVAASGLPVVISIQEQPDPAAPCLAV